MVLPRFEENADPSRVAGLGDDHVPVAITTGPDGTVIPHDQVHRTHLGSLNGFLAEVKRSDEVIGT